jgi:formate hydrogenlyase subunit 2
VNRFVIADSTVCIGCRTCEAACSETHRQYGLQAMPRLQVMRNEKESAPQMCHHCEDAPAPRCVRLMRSIASMARFS